MKARMALAALAVATLGLGACAAQPGMGPGAGAGPQARERWGPNHTPGWGMMSAQERAEHRERMQNAKTAAECRKEMEAQHQRMLARAKERGMPMPAQPNHDPCSGM